jgi:translation initiation factor IF-2
VVKEGKATRDAFVRVIRDGKVVHESRVNSLKRFKNDAKEVSAGLECGVGVDNYGDFQAGDILQFYHREKVT